MIQRGNQKYDFNFKNLKDNLYKTFGTYNLIAVLSPSLRNVPFSGIEWSYQMKDLGYDEKGNLKSSFKYDNESNSKDITNGEIIEEEKGGKSKVHRIIKVT